jgi:hypothetical protein
MSAKEEANVLINDKLFALAVESCNAALENTLENPVVEKLTLTGLFFDSLINDPYDGQLRCF